MVPDVSEESREPDAEETAEMAVPEVPSAPAALDPLAEFGIEIPPGAPVIPADRTLEIGGSVSFVLDVASISKAERFYHELFEMDVVCRAWRLDDGSWDATTEAIDWDAHLIDGYYPELVVLERPGWRMVLHGMGRGAVLPVPKLGDMEVPVSPETLRQLRAKILIKAYTVVQDEPDSFAFRDPYAIVWTLVPDPSLSPRG